MSDINVFDLMEQLDADPEVRKAEGRGGGGYIGLVSFDTGYTFIQTGYNAAEVFIPFTDKVSAMKALEAIRPQAKAAGSKAAKACRFTLHKDTVKGSKVLENDRVWCFATWFKSFADPDVGVGQAMKALGLVTTGDYWLRMSFREDPRGGTWTDQEGNEQPNLFAYPADKYENEAEATKAGTEQAANQAVSDEPIDVPVWLVDVARTAMAEGSTPEQIAEKYGTTVEAVNAALA